MAIKEKKSDQHPRASLPSLPWRTRISLFAISNVADFFCPTNGAVTRRLLNFLDFKSPPNPKPINGVKTLDITVDPLPSRNLWYRLFVPVGYRVSHRLPVIVFFHGGGFVFLKANSLAYDAVCRRFARKLPAVVVSVDYRLSPEHKYPAQYEDGFDVLKFLDENVGRSALPENADLSRCFLAGDSAGANIAHHVARMACRTKFQQLKVIGLVSIQPFFGGEERTESERRHVKSSYMLTPVCRTDKIWRLFMPREEGGDRDHGAINVSGPRAFDITTLEFPATMLVVSEYDALRDRQMMYYDWLKESGKEACLVDYPDMVHAFYVFPELPQSAHLISEVKGFVNRRCSKMAATSEDLQ